MPRPLFVVRFASLAACSLLASFAFAQDAPAPAPAPVAAPSPAIVATVTEPAYPEMWAKIRDEGMNRSQLPQTLSYLTDVIGPRLTGSANLKRANEWTRDQLTKYGLKNAQLEAWGPFGRGWALERFSMQAIEPLAFPVVAYPKAWSPGWKGVKQADVVFLEAKTEADLQAYKGKLKGKFVLVSPVRAVNAHFEPEGDRYTEAQLEQLANAPLPPARRSQTGGQPAPSRENLTPEQRRDMEAAVAQRRFAPARNRFLMDEGAALVIDSGRGDGGNLFVQQATATLPARTGTNITPNSPNPSPAGEAPRAPSVWTKEAERLILPQVTVSVEHYNRLVRTIQAGQKVKLAVELKTRTEEPDKGMAFNTVAEIPGTDKADEIVMCGAHIDSWQGGTGATDNGAGVAACMEAVRILQTLGVKPRRTIRIGLWSGEEQGLFGSRAYVTQHFGTTQAPKPEADKVSAYFNIDNGTGKLRGVWAQSNEAVLPIFTAYLEPLKDLGATTVTRRNTGGTDHLSFDALGIPGFQFIQDTVEYNTRTHHSTQDTYDRIQEADLKQASVVLATFLYNTAMREEKLPRKK